jgi:hypothetical protein
MRLNKLEPIQELSKIKRLKPIPSLSPREEWQRGEIVSGVLINLLIAHILYNQKILIDTVMDTGEKRLQFHNSMMIIKYLFKVDEAGYMMKKEFMKIKKDLKIKFDK